MVTLLEGWSDKSGGIIRGGNLIRVVTLLEEWSDKSGDIIRGVT